MTKLTLDNEKQVFFYEQNFYVLSNFSSFSVEYNGNRFQTAEHLYQYFKFDYKADDNDLRNKLNRIKNSIYAANSAHEAFKISQECKEFRDPVWDNIKFEKMLQVLRLKVEQHEYVKKKLLETGDRELIENSWRDDVWGWGENRDGQNALGKLWMLVRSEVKILENLKNPSFEQSNTDNNLIYPNSNSEFHNLISNLQIGDEIWKGQIDVESDRVIKTYKILQVDYICQNIVEISGYSSIISFSEFTEKQQNSKLMGYWIGNSPVNIYNFLNKFSEPGFILGIRRSEIIFYSK